MLFLNSNSILASQAASRTVNNGSYHQIADIRWLRENPTNIVRCPTESHIDNGPAADGATIGSTLNVSARHSRIASCTYWTECNTTLLLCLSQWVVIITFYISFTIGL